MAEVDDILILTLKQIGCSIPENVSSVKEFDTDHIVEACATCLKIIAGPESKTFFPKKLPPGKSSRFRICTDLANAIKQLGYRNEVGFDQFLYPNEGDTKKIITFLVESLPKQGEPGEAAEESLGSNVILNKKIVQDLKRLNQTPWNALAGGMVKVQPQSRHFESQPLHTPGSLLALDSNEDVKKYVKSRLPFVNQQCTTPRRLLPSLLQSHRARLVMDMEMTERESELGGDEAKSVKTEKLRKLIMSTLRESVQQTGWSTTGSKSSQQVDAYDSLRKMIETSYSAIDSNASTRGTIFSHQSNFAHENEEVGIITVETDELQQASTKGGEGTEGEEKKDDTPKETPEEMRKRKAAELQQQRETELREMEESHNALQRTIAQLEKEVEIQAQETQQGELALKSEQEKTQTLEAAYTTKKKTMDLLQDAEKNMKELKQITNATATHLSELAAEWENHRRPLLEKYRDMKEKAERRREDCREKLAKIKFMREEMKQVASDAREKEERYKQLVAEYDKLPKTINRNSYIRRIMDIVKQIKKQDVDIQKILADTRQLQKEINNVTEAQGRSFAATDELVFKNATKDENIKKAYKQLVALHESFGKLVTCVEDTGSTQNQIRDYENQIEALSAKISNLNMERVEQDLEEVKKENVELQKQLGR